MTIRAMAKALRARFTGEGQVSVSNGTIVVREGFFYRHGRDACDHTLNVERAVVALSLPLHPVKDGEVWKSFKGGASLRASSHWYTVLAPL